MPRPAKIADVLSELFTRRGFARVQAGAAYAEAWQAAAGEAMARETRMVAVRRGTAEILAANSTLAQELTFQKRDILRRLAAHLPDDNITGLRCRVGPVK